MAAAASRPRSKRPSRLRTNPFGPFRARTFLEKRSNGIPNSIPHSRFPSGAEFRGFRAVPNPQQDARLERAVALSARSLGDGVQKIVLAAKQGDSGEWKQDLLQLLSGDKVVVGEHAASSPNNANNDSDMAVLLKNSKLERFVLRCVENELPPNLIHCLRLLRVLELQYADDQPHSAKATDNVAKLLTILCTEPSVGEQLRPHLFGLLALSGASYPPCGVHIAQAASSVIVALAEHCLTRQLVWFIHDRKMILHMTDDIKELCGLSESKNSVPNGLLGADAEELWAVALETVVQLVYHSCRVPGAELVRDLEAAGGYKVVHHAIKNATSAHGKRLVELLPVLACCSGEEKKIASNSSALEIQEALLLGSNPLLREYRAKHDDERPDIRSSLSSLATLSVEYAVDLRSGAEDLDNKGFAFDLSGELLAITLQLFSDHPENFEILESRQHILSYYLLAFPCFRDEDLKGFILKTLEFVLTGVGVGDEITPVSACVEIFFALCFALMDESRAFANLGDNKQEVSRLLAADTLLMGKTLEKLLQFDERVAPVLVDTGILGGNLNSMLTIIASHCKSASEGDGVRPPATTRLDDTVSIVCRVLKLLVSHQPTTPSGNEEGSNLHKLLRHGVLDLGSTAAFGACGVFEAYMSSFVSTDTLKDDMRFVFDVLRRLNDAVASSMGPTLDAVLLERQEMLVSLLRSVLEARSMAREAFRECDGYQAILSVLVSFRCSNPADIWSRDGFAKSMESLILAVLNLVEASVGSKARTGTSEMYPLLLPPDLQIDPTSSQLSSKCPATENVNYIRNTRFYLKLAAAVVSSGILDTDSARNTFEMAFSHCDPALSKLGAAADVQSVRNPDGVRFVLGLALFSPTSADGIATEAFDDILRLCQPSRSATTLSQIATSGMCRSLTDFDEYGAVLFSDHPRQWHFLELLHSVAAFSMSYADFVSLLRCIAGRFLAVGSADGRVRLPVISSSISRKSLADTVSPNWASVPSPETMEPMIDRLKFLCEVAKRGARFPRVTVGGDSINTIAVLMHKVQLEDRLRAASEEGRLKFLEVECIDSSAMKKDESSEAALAGSSDKVWSPLTSGGFSYSLWLRIPENQEEGNQGNLYILDISSPDASSSSVNQNSSFLAVWYDLQNQRFNVMSSASHRGEPTCFPVSPLLSGVWHHVLVTYTPAKRSVISWKSSFAIFVDGRPLEAEVKVDSVSLPPNSKLLLGAPNPALAASGIVRGKIPTWEAGPVVMLSTVLLELDATAIFAYGPGFPGLLWGDRPQRLSLAATATATFLGLVATGESGSVSSALRRRDVAKLERAGYTTLGDTEKDTLSSMNMHCSIPPDCVVFGFLASTATSKVRNEKSRGLRRNLCERLVNLARLNIANETVSTDAIVYGRGSVSSPSSFSDSLQWVGGPLVLFPLVDKSVSPDALALSLRLIRESTRSHRPNLEGMQANGGYRVLAVLLQEKGVLDEQTLHECLAFAVHGATGSARIESKSGVELLSSPPSSWVLADIDAAKHLLLNHQIWNLRKRGPKVTFSLLQNLNTLVDPPAVHKAFNARRLHMIGIVNWALHLMIEGTELMSSPESLRQSAEYVEWTYDAPLVVDVSIGAEPGNPFMQYCKDLLRRVLTFMLTPDDLEGIADAIVYTVVPPGKSTRGSTRTHREIEVEVRMLPGPTMRLYLVRLLEELIVDGVNEIVSPGTTTSTVARSDKGSQKEPPILPHTGGVASPNQPYFGTIGCRGQKKEGYGLHPKHQQAQSFLSAFAGYLTPAWFATLLEGCQEEASACATFRLMILLLQNSATFETSFIEAGGFAPFVLSIPRFSTSPGIFIPLFSHLFNAPLLHLHSLTTLDAEQLCELFNLESSQEENVWHSPSMDPASGTFALLMEVVGRNMQLIATKNELSDQAASINRSVFELLCHRHRMSKPFRAFCCSPAFVEPLAQALCIASEERLQSRVAGKPKRRSMLADVPGDLSPTERYIGTAEESGLGIVKLVDHLIGDVIHTRASAAAVLSNLFRSFPVHASPLQVEAFHLILIERCVPIVKEAMESGSNVAVANSVGLTSVLLDVSIRGLLSSEAISEAVKLSVLLLNELLAGNSPALKRLPNNEASSLVLDCAHLSRLTCATALRNSQPTGRFQERGDEDLQAEVLETIDRNILVLLLIPDRERRLNVKSPTGPCAKPSSSSRLYPIWRSASLHRCMARQKCLYPDLSESESPDEAFLAPLLVSLHALLLDSREDVRALSISVFVALLQHRQNILSELLVVEVTDGDHTETIDVVSRGGFRALLISHEAAIINDNTSAASQSVKRKYAAFFDWFDKNVGQVQLVFDDVASRSNELFPFLERTSVTQDEAIEYEQKVSLSTMSSRGTSDRSILGGMERAELGRRCVEKTADDHLQWRREGFDDLAFGAMKWKIILRRMKGSSSIWEGGARVTPQLTLPSPLAILERKESTSLEEEIIDQHPWKLDLTEGYERQRRRLLPNYEFRGLYNLDEDQEKDGALETSVSVDQKADYLGSTQMEATTELLKDLNIKRANRTDDDDEEFADFDDTEDTQTVATTATNTSSLNDAASTVSNEEEPTNRKGSADGSIDFAERFQNPEKHEHSSNYRLISGLLQAGDWPERSYNVSRCTGLEVSKALLLWCSDAIYVVDGFEQIGGVNGPIVSVERVQSSFNVSLRKSKDADTKPDDKHRKSIKSLTPKAPTVAVSSEASSQEVVYQHRSQRIAFADLFCVYRRRYNLLQNALEFYDVNNTATLLAFEDHKNREDVLSRVLQSKLPNSVFNSMYGSFVSYTKFISNLKAKVISQWVSGRMSNFELLMHLNSFAGRSFNDLTQYPVFPWVIADYESEEIDLNDPKIYRDLSKPMGAIGEERAQQFRERYEALSSTCMTEDDPPPFHYGTHYSCAAYVLYYLMRLEPFSRLALSLQGGRFDVADRLFHDVGKSWKSASNENLQDVRELIPEFFYLPDFLQNSNNFDFGETQKGKTVIDVSLPPWAKGDPRRFVQINRQALESEYVSKNLHLWIDLVFGYKQRGQEAVDSLNTFVHVTYEGEVDLEAMEDPIQRASTIAQIQNFGQTPSRLERRPFPQRSVPNPLKQSAIDFGALAPLTPLTPPFCVVGAPHRVQVGAMQSEPCSVGVYGQGNHSVGDMCYVKGQLIGVGRLCSILIPSKRYVRFGGVNNGVSIHTAAISTRYREVNKLLSVHDAMHRSPITIAKPSRNGSWLVTGCVDSTIRVWRVEEHMSLRATLCGHDGHAIECIDVSTEFGMIVTGCAQGKVLLWDLRSLTFVRELVKPQVDGSKAISVSINNKTGNVLVLVGSDLRLFDVNGTLLAETLLSSADSPSCAVATDCPEWMESGVVAVTGHLSGQVNFWTLSSLGLVLRSTLEHNPHTDAISCLRVAGLERNDTLLVGDRSGHMSVCKTAQLDSFSSSELERVVDELKDLQQQ